MEAAPRINKSLMPQYLGKTVRLVGKVESVPDRNGEAAILSSDGERVKILHANPSTFCTAFVEVLGKVNSDGSIQEYTSSSFGNTFGAPPPLSFHFSFDDRLTKRAADLASYNEMIVLAHMHQEIFIR